VPRPYPPEFRRRALDLVESGRTIRDVATSLGIAESCLHRWRHRDLVDQGIKPGVTERESGELAAARARIRDLEEEVKILRKAAAAVEAVVPPKARYRLVAELRAEGVRTGRSCHALSVSRSGYYDWASRAPSPRSIRHAWLTDLIGTIHQASRGTYGVPRVHAELVHGHGITVGHNTVSLLMRRAGVAGLPARSRGKRTPKLATVTDLVKRDFRRTGPNQLWVTDIERHEALSNRVGVGDLHRRAVAAAWL
jgi:putative transposase